MQFPLAPASFEATHHEAVGALLLLYVSEHRLDRLAAQPIEGATGFGSQPAVHALAWRRGLRYPTAWRWRFAQDGTLPVVRNRR